MIPLVILRPEPGATVTANRAGALGLTPRVHPLFAVAPAPWDAPDPALFDALLITSANAIRAGGGAVLLYRDLPVFAVGAATAQAARDAGFGRVIEGSGSAADALRTLAKAGHSRPLHLAGEDRTLYPHLPFSVTTRAVYAAQPIEVTLPTGRYVGLLHSARAATRFADLCPSPRLVELIAISAAVAEAAGTGWKSITIAPEPTDNAMLALAALLCDGKSTPTGRN
jgi:uroporphyrinogen-III synthase